MRSRYRFMLEEAHFTIAGFLKGPVCRGQMRSSVIDDRFWVFFADPDSARASIATPNSSRSQADYLRLPAESGSNAFPLDWLGYGRTAKEVPRAQGPALRGGVLKALDTRRPWTCCGTATASTPAPGSPMFRHFDQGSVVQGLVGTPPKTAWIIGYPLLERIHYLLVAGSTSTATSGTSSTRASTWTSCAWTARRTSSRCCPSASRKAVRDHWYRGAESRAKEYIDGAATQFPLETGIAFKTADAGARADADGARAAASGARPQGRAGARQASPAVQAAIGRLRDLEGRRVSFLPQLAWLIVGRKRRRALPSLFCTTMDTATSRTFWTRTSGARPTKTR